MKQDLHPDRIYENLDWSDSETAEELAALARLGLWARENANFILAFFQEPDGRSPLATKLIKESFAEFVKLYATPEDLHDYCK